MVDLDPRRGYSLRVCSISRTCISREEGASGIGTMEKATDGLNRINNHDPRLRAYIRDSPSATGRMTLADRRVIDDLGSRPTFWR